MNIPSYAMTAAKLREQEALSWLDRTARQSAGDDPASWKWTWVNPGAPENVRAVRTVDLDALLGGPGARGAALLAVALPGTMGDPTAELVTVTDLAVTAKVSRYGSLVWVTRLSNGAPVEGASVAIPQGQQARGLYATTTDASGLAAIPGRSLQSSLSDSRARRAGRVPLRPQGRRLDLPARRARRGQ